MVLQAYNSVMNILTIVYANHRPETLRLSQPIMGEHQVVVLEEPPHPAFRQMLDRRVDTADYLLEQDIEYPAFSSQQCRLLRELHQAGIHIVQVEPYLEHLFAVQSFFADGHGPDDLDESTIEYQVYIREREATGKLIAFYQAVRQDDFEHIIASVKAFARSDARRFQLRDLLRAQAITVQLEKHDSICVEAGPMHIMLYRHLRDLLPGGWQVRPVFVEHHALKTIGSRSGLYSPGDTLTAHYLLDNPITVEYQNRLCARALIFMKIVSKEEFSEWHQDFPHLRNESEANGLVKRLSYESCKSLFLQMRDLPAEKCLHLMQSKCI
jgi:hypothetical protein